MPDNQKGLVYDLIVDHELRNVTVEMIDWFADNMEKGYPLWCPEEHISLEWVLSPGKNGHLGAIQFAREYVSEGPVIELRAGFSDPDKMVNLPIFCEHIQGGGMPGPDGKMRSFLTHQYEATSYGTRMRSVVHMENGWPRDTAEAFVRHNKAEMGRFAHFLPQLYKMWQVVKDPAINVPCCLKYPYKDINKPK